MNHSSNNKRVLKIAAIFAVVALTTFSSIMAIMYIRDHSSNNGTGSEANSNSEVVEKNDDQTASMRYMGFITVQPSENNISLYFENPIRSRKSVKLEITCDIDGESVTLAEVDNLAPGDRVENVPYNLAKKLEPGRYTGAFVLHFYDESGKEEIVNSNISIDVVVK